MAGYTSIRENCSNHCLLGANNTLYEANSKKKKNNELNVRFQP